MSDVDATIEAALKAHHILQLEYVDRAGKDERIVGEPYGFRSNSANHHVLWVWNVDRGRFEELIGGRIRNATDTGQAFTPRPDWQSKVGVAAD